jgi:two-component system cell cycle sensor histidine kinase/response regulator CckA
VTRRSTLSSDRADLAHRAPKKRHTLSVSDPYRELFERSADAILFIEGEMFVDCNDAAVKMLRCRNRAEVLSTHPSELSPETQPDGRPSFEKASEMIATAFERGSHRFEWNHMRADGEVFPVEVLLTAVGNRLHVVWRELSERKLLEAKLCEAQKMEVVGLLAAGVAHDFNNLLVVVLGNADLLCATLDPDATEAHLAAEIRDAGERGSHLVKRLLALGRKQQFVPSALELASVVDDLAGLARRLLGPNIRLAIEHGEVVTIAADRGQLEQAILNLAANSRDAMRAGGKVVITTGVCEAEAEPELGLPAVGRFGFLRVQDNGEGMDAATLARACEPFFTTKPAGAGTGLGLASVQNMVHQSGGFLHISSELGRGTTVGLYWPLDHIVEAPPPPEPEHPIDERSSTSLTDVKILLVEDEDPVAGFVERTLHENGCVLTRATNGQQALDLFDADPSFDMILSDVIMPVMGGPAFVAVLRKRNIQIPVVFMSGYTNDAIAAAGLGADAVLLEKPFSPWELRRAVRRAVHRN